MEPTYIIDGKQVTTAQWKELVWTMHAHTEQKNNAVTTQENLEYLALLSLRLDDN